MDGRLFTVSGVILCLLILGLWNPYTVSVAHWDHAHAIDAHPEQAKPGKIVFAREPTDQWRGVVPDVSVDFDLPYLQGRDPLLEAAKKQFHEVLVRKTRLKKVSKMLR